MILKADMAEDDELLSLASEVYRQGKYDEVILHYLMLYRFGPVDELLSIWKSAKGFEMDTYDLEERILSLLMFTSDYRKEGESVLESYVKQSGKERITGAYLTQVAYGIFVKEYPMTRFIRQRLEYAWENHWPVNRICRLALLMDISKEKHMKTRHRKIAEEILEEWKEENPRPCLLKGVTGSGKTAVYMELIDKVLARGEQVIVLIPEIALTYQNVSRFYSRFGDGVSVMNSRLSKGERWESV